MYDVLDQLRPALAEHYLISGVLGRGGMATVYCARDVRHDRDVAIKVLSPDQSASVGAERFHREVRIATRLSHPNILPVYDSGDVDGLLWYAMPLVTGESLRARLEHEQQLPIDEAVSIVCEVADALTYAHAHGVIHRDVKPENILLHGGHAVLADFGIARPSDQDGTRLTGTGISIGTAAYMSPEQATGETVDQRSDVYSLGAVLYECLVGQPPFTGPNAMAIIARMLAEQPPAIAVVRHAVPLEIESAVMKALDSTPADRFQTVAQFKAALLGGAATPYASRTMRNTAMRQTVARRATRTRVLIVAAVTVVVGVTGAFAAMRLRATPRASITDASVRRVGVLYFADASRDGSLRAVADGLTENLTERLAQVPVLDVIPEDGLRPYRGRDVPLDSIGRALHAGLLVNGEVRPATGGMDVRVTLADAASGEKLRTATFHHASADVTTLQRDVADHVAQFLREQVGDQVQLRGERNTTRSSAAWLLAVRAAKRRHDADSLIDARDIAGATAALHDADSLFAQAQRADARWPVAPTQRAFAAVRRGSLLRQEPTALATVVDSGITHADRALGLAPNDPDALEAKGALLWMRYDNHLVIDQHAAAATLAQAESLLKAAVDIDKNHAGAWLTLGQLYYRIPDLNLALDAFRNAYAADAYLSSARDILSRLATTSYNLELYPDARRWCDLGRQRFPNDPAFAKCRLMLYSGRGETPDADSVWTWERRYIELTPPPMRAHAELEARIFAAGGLVRDGLADSARHVLSDVLRRSTPMLDPHKDVAALSAFVYVMLGDQDKAVDELQDYITVNPEHRKGFATRVIWWWRDLQSNDRFRKLILGSR